MKTFFESFNEIMMKMLTIRCPVIAGIKGHAIAGGYILSLGADIRIVGNNRSKFGLSEVDLGVAVPSSARVLLGFRTTPQSALILSATGQLLDATEAVKWVTPQRQLNTISCAEHCRQLASKQVMALV